MNAAQGELLDALIPVPAAVRAEERERELVLSRGRVALKLSESARFIWQLCDGRRTVGEIGATIERRFDLPRGTVSIDVSTALLELQRAQFVRLVRPGSAGASAAGPPKVLEPVRVFVGTDARQSRAELALEYSIRRNTTGPVEIVWMDHARGGIWAGWNIGRERGRPTLGMGQGWATEFTCFRFAIPEAAGFRGRAIYLDSDMIVLGDLRELFEQTMAQPWLRTPSCGATMLIDCAFFRDKTWWPSIEQMKPSGWVWSDYTSLFGGRGLGGTIPDKWNCHDGKGFVPGETAILHFTAETTQPWMPYPEHVEYRSHPCDGLAEIWWEMYLAAKEEAAKRAGRPAPPTLA